MLRITRGIAEGDGDIGASLGESEGGSASQTAGAAGDEAGLAAQRFVGVFVHGGILPLSPRLLSFLDNFVLESALEGRLQSTRCRSPARSWFTRARDAIFASW